MPSRMIGSIKLEDTETLLKYQLILTVHFMLEILCFDFIHV